MPSLMVEAVQTGVAAFALRYAPPVVRSRRTKPTVPGRVCKYCSASTRRCRKSHCPVAASQDADARGAISGLSFAATRAHIARAALESIAFQSAALLQAALERWENVEQEALFGALEKVPDARERLRALFHMVAREYKSHVIYSALLKAQDHPTVQPVIERVSKRRLDYLTASFRQAGLGREDAQHRARLTYAAYVGFLQLNLQLHQARMQQDEFDAYVEHLAQTLVPA